MTDLNEHRHPEKRTYTVDETSAILGLGRASTYQAVRDGSIPSLRIGGRILIPRRVLLDLLGETETTKEAGS
jgi:excisionase family DNA binding protein